MLNIEAGKRNKPIRMDSNIILDAGIRVGAVSPYQRSVRSIVDEDVRESSTNSAKTLRSITQGVPG